MRKNSFMFLILFRYFIRMFFMLEYLKFIFKVSNQSYDIINTLFVMIKCKYF